MDPSPPHPHPPLPLSTPAGPTTTGLLTDQLSFSHANEKNSPARPLLSNLNIRFGQGRFCAVVGPNGSGKTTLLRLLAGLIAPQSGRVLHDGSNVADLSSSQRAARIAYVPQAPSVWAAITVRDYINLGRYSRPRCTLAVDAALERFELTELAHRPVNTLSAGQLQRSAIARAIAQLTPAGQGLNLDNNSDSNADNNATPAHQPTAATVLLADEPLSALDPRHATLTLDLFTRLASIGWTVIAALHDLNIARQHAHDALLLPPGPDTRPAAAASPSTTTPPPHAATTISPAFGPARETLTPKALTSAFGVQFTLLRSPDSPHDYLITNPPRPTSSASHTGHIQA